MTTEFTTQSLRSRPPTLEIMRTGPLALIEDLGRPGLAHLGVTRSGAADRRSHTLANRLVSNPADRAT
ncbi:MAG: allophanate hydrolase subunit 2 family protein, partial [Mycobacterium sp.]